MWLHTSCYLASTGNDGILTRLTTYSGVEAALSVLTARNVVCGIEIREDLSKSILCRRKPLFRLLPISGTTSGCIIAYRNHFDMRAFVHVRTIQYIPLASHSYSHVLRAELRATSLFAAGQLCKLVPVALGGVVLEWVTGDW